jgi:hypothetical protein
MPSSLAIFALDRSPRATNFTASSINSGLYLLYSLRSIGYLPWLPHGTSELPVGAAPANFIAVIAP